MLASTMDSNDHQLYFELFEFAPDAYFLTDAETRPRCANAAAEQLLGIPRRELLRHPLLDLVPASGRGIFQARVAALAAGRASRIQDWNLEIECKGRRLDLETTVERHLREGVVDLRWLMRNVTERRHAEAAWQLSSARYRSLVESAVDGIITIDSRGIIESINRAGEEIFGYTAEELLGRGLEVLMPEPFRSRHNSYINNYLRTGERRIIGIGREVVGQRKDGTVFPIDLAVSEVRSGDKIFFVGTIRNLTQRKETENQLRQLEEQMRQAQKMEAIGRLAGGIAHDFNTLLGSILGYSEMILADLPGDSAAHRNAGMIHKAAERGAALTRQLLAFSRRQVLRPAVVDLGGAIRDLDELFVRLIPANITLCRRLTDQSLPVRADPSQLDQVLMNLVVNACDAMPQGGELVLETCAVALGREEEKGPEKLDHALLVVRDNGIGMDEATRSRVFEPFFTTKEPGKGTGLGLSTVYGIVTQSGGQIRLTSEKGLGAAFSVYLPLAEGALAPPRPPVAPVADAKGSGEIVLLVEDDPMFRELLAEVLEARGYVLWTAGDPQEALERCAKEKPRVPDLLVTDMIMPGGMTGVDLAQALRVDRPDLPVLRMSGYTDDAITLQMPSDPRGAFMHKPFSTRDFTTTVRRLLDQP